MDSRCRSKTLEKTIGGHLLNHEGLFYYSGETGLSRGEPVLIVDGIQPFK